MENKSLNNSVKCESLVQLAEEFVKTLSEGVAKLFNNDAFKEEALRAEYTFPLLDKAIREVLAENKEAMEDEIKRGLSDVGVLPHIMPTVISQLTDVIVNAVADEAVKYISDNILATPIRENGWI